MVLVQALVLAELAAANSCTVYQTTATLLLSVKIHKILAIDCLAAYICNL